MQSKKIYIYIYKQLKNQNLLERNIIIFKIPRPNLLHTSNLIPICTRQEVWKSKLNYARNVKRELSRPKVTKPNPSMIGSMPNHSEKDNAFSHLLFWVPQ